MSSTNTSPPSTFSERHAEALAACVASLQNCRYWYLKDQAKPASSINKGFLDTETGGRYSSTTPLNACLKEFPFLFLRNKKGAHLATLDCASMLLWQPDVTGRYLIVEAAHKALETNHTAGLARWTLPTRAQLLKFAQHASNPHRQGRSPHLQGRLQHGRAELEVEAALCTTGALWLADEITIAYERAPVYACNDSWVGASLASIAAHMRNCDLYLTLPNRDDILFSVAGSTEYLDVSIEAMLVSMAEQGLCLQSADKARQILNLSELKMEMQLENLENLDYIPCRLPKLDDGQLTDRNQGLWELWGESPETLERLGASARDPQADIQRHAVAIDFGTSGTVVAIDKANGARELLRIGVRDFFAAPKPADFENPTVLECLQFTNFKQAWGKTAYRPALDWDWMHAAHEAQATLRDPETLKDPAILSRILPKLKQWALRAADQTVRLTDQQGYEYELPTYCERNPVRGQALSVSANDPFDPIELYAWFLGMAINWRKRGLFLKYYLSFPVKYSKEVKACILASFRRGLQRSLPPTLISHYPSVLHDFSVTDLASEPAAYAAAALAHLDIKPTDEGVPYAVFDFGGGTTDFDFGLLRWATAEEEDQGYESVFEHYANGGDKFLGGENLLEHLVYESFKNNLDTLRKHRIQFTQPIDSQGFSGSEALLARTQAAQTNTAILAATLRAFLESETPKLNSQIKLDLINVQGEKVSCELGFKQDYLDALLAGRVCAGVEAFLHELRGVLPNFPADATIHILLAGNGSRSRHVRQAFEVVETTYEEKEGGFKVKVHAPLPMDASNPHAPTAKTGVALGLLRLTPGKGVLMRSHVQDQHDGQAPFAWYVGRMRRGHMQPVILPGTEYGQWHKIGPVQGGMFNLYVSASPRAGQDDGLPEGHHELIYYPLDFAAAEAGSQVFARAINPNELEYCAALSEDACNAGTLVVQTLRLSAAH